MRWTTPATTISQATKTLTAIAATIGEPTASTPRQISNTPHKCDNVVACRTTPERFCTIKTSSSDGGSLLQKGPGIHPKIAGVHCHDPYVEVPFVFNTSPRSDGQRSCLWTLRNARIRKACPALEQLAMRRRCC